MSLIADSWEKSKLIKKIAKLNVKIQNTNSDSLRANKDILYDQLWNSMHNFPQLVEVIEKYNYTQEEFRHDSDRIYLMGYEWEKGEYLPLSLLCFAPPLDFFLSEKSSVEDNNDFRVLIYKTLMVLKLM